jgi:hypothetical protein
MALGPRAKEYHGIGDDGLTDDQRRVKQMLELLRLINKADRNYAVFDCPTGGAIRIKMQAALNG